MDYGLISYKDRESLQNYMAEGVWAVAGRSIRTLRPRLDLTYFETVWNQGHRIHIQGFGFHIHAIKLGPSIAERTITDRLNLNVLLDLISTVQTRMDGREVVAYLWRPSASAQTQLR
jgi:hypothetical protein